MKQDTHITRVIFRKFDNGEILALFPDIKAGFNTIESYMHVGQHSAASYLHCINITTLATETEYKDLFEELESIGYKLKVNKRLFRK